MARKPRKYTCWTHDSYLTGVTSGAGTAHPPVTPKITSEF